MANYKISGVWKRNGVISHYAVHTENADGSHTKSVKTTKTDAIALVEKHGNSVYTWIWSYNRASWTLGEKVHVVGAGNNKYLRSNPDSKVTDNLDHLINYEWI